MDTLNIPLPRSWPQHVKSAMMHVVSLAHEASFLGGRKYLPIVKLRKTA